MSSLKLKCIATILLMGAAAPMSAVAAVTLLDYAVHLDVIHSGYDGEYCWVHARAGVVPGDAPLAVLTMQRLALSGSDVFYGLHVMRAVLPGRQWEGPFEQPLLRRRADTNGRETVVCDFSPKWHEATGRLLGTGHIAQYRGNKLATDRQRVTAYAVYDVHAGVFGPWRTLEMPGTADSPSEDAFFNSGAGSTQRVDLPDGDILLPIYHRTGEAKQFSASVLRCRFDGETMTVIEHGNALTVNIERGLYEPSLAAFQGRYYLTLRNDIAGYVAVSDDGLHFDAPRVWHFDDGATLGNYNTQQHWVVHPDALFLVYTRRGAKNDHVFRHRAPLFMAQVNPETLTIIRASERILIPERGARLGNFGVTYINDAESWVTVTEWMQPAGCEQYGSDNSVYVARLLWKQSESTTQ